MEKSLRRIPVHQAVRHYVKQFILDQGLAPGDALPPETQLAQKLGVGRSSVREAIKALESLGIVEVRHGDGLYVREYNFASFLEALDYGVSFDTNTLADLTQIRRLLEGATIEDAVACIDENGLARLEAILESWQERIAAGEPHVELDEAFHRVLYGALNNQALLKLLEVFWLTFRNLDAPAIPSADPVLELEEHWAILSAVKARDAVLSRHHLLKHFEHLEGRISAAQGLPEPTDRTGEMPKKGINGNT